MNDQPETWSYIQKAALYADTRKRIAILIENLDVVLARVNADKKGDQ